MKRIRRLDTLSSVIIAKKRFSLLLLFLINESRVHIRMKSRKDVFFPLGTWKRNKKGSKITHSSRLKRNSIIQIEKCTRSCGIDRTNQYSPIN